jgi:hypothetical protein
LCPNGATHVHVGAPPPYKHGSPQKGYESKKGCRRTASFFHSTGPGQPDPEITAEQKCATTEKAKQPQRDRLGYTPVQVIEYRRIRNARCTTKTGGSDLSPIRRNLRYIITPRTNPGVYVPDLLCNDLEEGFSSTLCRAYSHRTVNTGNVRVGSIRRP